jgi:Trypsin
VPHGQYRNDSDGTPDAHDIGYLVLAKAFRSVKPLTIRRSRHTDTCNYVATGYGTTAQDGSGDTGQRKALSMCALEAFSFGMIESYSKTGGAICGGDSGGPLRLDNTLEIVGVVSGPLPKPTAPCQNGWHTLYTAVAQNLVFVDEAYAKRER